MRTTLSALAAVCLLAPVPAFAAEPDDETANMARDLADPAKQAEISAMVGTMAEALLAMPAAPLLRAAATMAGENPETVDENTTVGDLAGPEAVEAPREFAHRLPQMMSAMASLAAALDRMAPLLRERLAETVPPDNQ
jgi:hypothetical protein